MLRHLHDHKNDFPGAFRVIHKKLRTLYVNAYQSYLFNEVLASFEKTQERNLSEVSGVSFNCVLDRLDVLPDEIELMHESIDTSTSYGIIYQEIFKKDGLSLENFGFISMPELKQDFVSRKTRVFPSDLKIHCVSDDDLFENKNKMIISFSLESGAYATNVIKQLLN